MAGPGTAGLGSPSSPQVLVYDLLFGKGLKCGGRWKALARRHRARLEAELARLKVQQKVSRNEDLLAPQAASPAGEWAWGRALSLRWWQRWVVSDPTGSHSPPGTALRPSQHPEDLCGQCD